MAGAAGWFCHKPADDVSRYEPLTTTRLVLTARPTELGSLPNVLSPEFEKRFSLGGDKMIYRVAIAILAGSLAAGAASAQSTAPSGDKNKAETSCTTTGTATSGSGEEKTANSMAVEKSAVLPDAGGANSAAPTVQSGGKPLEVRKDCPPDSKAK
jgi:hypothetical protein